MAPAVFINPRVLAGSLIPSAVEEYHKEVSGYLIGRGRAGKLTILSAYPLLADSRKPTSVAHGNLSAVGRVQGVMDTLHLSLVGGFHSHPDGPNRLSKSDLEFIREAMAERGQQRWLEVLLAVRKKDYQRPHEPGWDLERQGQQLELQLRPDPWTAYLVTLTGHWVLPEGKPAPARLATRVLAK
ncbi:MAG: Mov34/MPN/PAD-1 family protein [Candidatus Aenigmarchaeota archaeon]|nr:Mov34/MPN/PAD-1 family protein [Candidatus Aenigmarchaeota archaeon]